MRYLPTLPRPFSRPVSEALTVLRKRSAHHLVLATVGFPRLFPNEVLLLILDQVVPDQRLGGVYEQARATLRKLCLTSKSLNQLATSVLYRDLVFLTRAQFEMFLRTAGSKRWTIGPMKGILKAHPRMIAFEYSDKSTNETHLVEWILDLVNPGSITSLRMASMAIAMSALAPLTSQLSSLIGGPSPNRASNPTLYSRRPS